MVSKKHATRVAPNVSSAASLSAATGTHNANASTIHKSAFAPSIFQLSLFASVIQGLNGHQLRIHDTVSGRLQCQHDMQGSTRLASLDWGFYGDSGQLSVSQSPKKKRRLEETNGAKPSSGEAVLGIATNQSDIHLFSPASAKIVGSLKGGHTGGVKDFKFVNYGRDGQGWSLGGDKRLVQWSLHDQTALRSIEVPASPASVLLPLRSAVFVASNDIWLVNLETDGAISQVANGANAVQSILASIPPNSAKQPKQFLTASQDERQIMVRDISSSNPAMLTLNATGDIEFLAIDQDSLTQSKHDGKRKPRAVAAGTKRGELEVFAEPFEFQDPASNDSANLKSKRKYQTKRPNATITIRYKDNQAAALPLIGACFHREELVIAYAESGGQVGFERLIWQDPESGEMGLEGPMNIAKARKLVAVDTSDKVGAKIIGRSQVDESRAIVSYATTSGDAMAVDEPDIISISSGVEDSEDEDEDEEDDNEGDRDGAQPNGPSRRDIAMEDARPELDLKDEGIAADAADEEPTFGDLIRSNGVDTIDVAASLSKNERSMIPYGHDGNKIPAGLTLGNVLTQALRTNDGSLLENCFHEQDLHVVRATIERLDSSLATALLQKLAEKLHSRPGRAGTLLVWVQWTLIAHGGYLGSQADTVKKLAALQRVVKERASSLQPLLSLKGKLDMLEAQMNLRRSMLGRSGGGEPMAEEEDPSVVYVEAPADSDSEASSDMGSEDEESVALEDEDGDPALDSEADTSDASDDVRGGLIDDEASETGDSDGGDPPEEEIDYDDVDSDDGSDEDEPPAKTKLPNGVRK